MIYKLNINVSITLIEVNYLRGQDFQACFETWDVDFHPKETEFFISAGIIEKLISMKNQIISIQTRPI